MRRVTLLSHKRRLHPSVPQAIRLRDFRIVGSMRLAKRWAPLYAERWSRESPGTVEGGAYP